MGSVEDQVVLVPSGNDAGDLQDCGSVLLDPLISERARRHQVFGIPVVDQTDSNNLNCNFIRDIDSNDAMVLWGLREIGMDDTSRSAPAYVAAA